MSYSPTDKQLSGLFPRSPKLSSPGDLIEADLLDGTELEKKFEDFFDCMEGSGFGGSD